MENFDYMNVIQQDWRGSIIKCTRNKPEDREEGFGFAKEERRRIVKISP